METDSRASLLLPARCAGRLHGLREILFQPGIGTVVLWELKITHRIAEAVGTG